MTFNGLIRDLKKTVGSSKIIFSNEELQVYAGDASYDLINHTPDVVVLPETVDDVIKVVRYAKAYKVAITPRGAGSGLAGGCTPLSGGIVLDMKRMNAIIEINRTNLTATCEAGVVLAQLHRAVEKEKLFYPPDPQSKSICTLGGNISTRAGGPRAIKYGTTGHYVLGLEIVLPDGEFIKTGNICLKHSVGYDLTHLFTGAEGTLGVIVKADLRLLPKPESQRTVIITCESVQQAADLIGDIVRAGIIPSTLEYLSRSPIKLFNKNIKPPLKEDGGAYLFVKLDGSKVGINDDLKKLEEICTETNSIDIRIVDNKNAALYWQMRANLYPMMVAQNDKIIPEDVTVPRDKIPAFIEKVKKISEYYKMKIGISGHAGDGNMHPSIIIPDRDKHTESEILMVIHEIIKSGLDLRGNISGEHGVGVLKSEFSYLELGERQIEVMKRIKKAIDPQGIMNPGKIWKN
jgi:glycolate oxidase